CHTFLFFFFNDVHDSLTLQPFPTRRSSDLLILNVATSLRCEHTTKSVNHVAIVAVDYVAIRGLHFQTIARRPGAAAQHAPITTRSEEHTSELQSRVDLVCRLLLEKKQRYYD